MKTVYWFSWCALLLVSGHCLGAAPLARYRYSRTIDGLFTQQELAATALDEHIWKAIGTTDIDIRIADQEGHAVPHMMRKAGTRSTRTVRHPRTSRIETLSDREDNQLELRIALERNTLGANTIFFDTPLKDFEKAVTVWGVAEDNSEKLHAKQIRIFDYSRFADVRNTSVTLPEESTQYRTFRVLIEDVVDEEQSPLRWETRRYEGDTETLREEHRRILMRPFRMNAVRMYERRIEDAGNIPQVAKQRFSAMSLRRDGDPAVTRIEVEHTGAPLSSIVFHCADANFSRRARVEIPVQRDGRETWRQIYSGQISRISFRDFKHESLLLRFPETRARRYRVTLFDHDNPPLQDISIQGKGPVLQAVFLADPEKEYTLYYGAVGPSRPPRYDLAPLERLLRQDHEPIVLSLQTETDNPLFRKAGWMAGENAMRILFGIAIIVMLIVLGTGLYRASRQIP